MLKTFLIAAPTLAISLGGAAVAQSPCLRAIDASETQNWGDCGSKTWKLQFDALSENGSQGYMSGLAFGEGTCLGGLTNCSGSYVSPSVSAAGKQIQYYLMAVSEMMVYWDIHERRSQVQTCPNNPQWLLETSWTDTYTTGYSFVYCN